MARAVLPTGQAIEFPDETPDHEIHAHVRNAMGLPPPFQVDGPTAIEAMGAMQQGFAELSQHLAAAIQTMQRTAIAMAGAVEQFQQSVHAIAQTVDAGAQRVAQSVAVGTDKMIHVSGEAVGLAATSANAVHDAARRIEAIGPRIEAIGPRIEDSVAAMAQKVDSAIGEVTTQLQRPKRAVKGKDGSWHTVDVET